MGKASTVKLTFFQFNDADISFRRSNDSAFWLNFRDRKDDGASTRRNRLATSTLREITIHRWRCDRAMVEIGLRLSSAPCLISRWPRLMKIRHRLIDIGCEEFLGTICVAPL